MRAVSSLLAGILGFCVLVSCKNGDYMTFDASKKAKENSADCEAYFRGKSILLSIDVADEPSYDDYIKYSLPSKLHMYQDKVSLLSLEKEFTVLKGEVSLPRSYSRGGYAFLFVDTAIDNAKPNFPHVRQALQNGKQVTRFVMTELDEYPEIRSVVDRENDSFSAAEIEIVDTKNFMFFYMKFPETELLVQPNENGSLGVACVRKLETSFESEVE